MGKLFWGRFHDAVGERLPTSVAGGAAYAAQKQALAAMPAQRREVARFKGSAFQAEREAETNELVIYHVSNSGAPLALDLVGDSAPGCGCGSSMDAGRMTAAKMQRRNEELRKRAGGR
jgi:hypothetical protein